jgi:hypothetical protein
MTVTVTSPVTGSAQTGFTAPTYTVVADTPPNASSKQYAVTAIGGTQTGVDASGTASKPWTFTASRPPNIRALSTIDPTTGQLRSVPMNDYVQLTRKGVLPLAGQPAKTLLIRTTESVPAGSDTADAANIRAALSFHLGALAQISSGLGDTLINGVL